MRKGKRITAGALGLLLSYYLSRGLLLPDGNALLTMLDVTGVPCRIGDVVTVGGKSGLVEDVTLRYVPAAGFTGETAAVILLPPPIRAKPRSGASPPSSGSGSSVRLAMPPRFSR